MEVRGEGFLLNTEERKQTLEAIMEEVGGEMTIIVHVGAISTRDSIELAEHAEKVGADALSAVPCIYYRVPESSIEGHWNNIINSTSLPFIIYNIPNLIGYDLSMGLLKKMLQNKKVIGVKNTAMNAYQTQQFKALGGKDFIVFNGPDEQYLAGRMMGAEAGIGGTYGVMPELFSKVEQCIREGNIKEAQKWQFKINEIITELLTFPSLQGPTKAITKLRGVDIGEPRLPLEPVPEGKYQKVVEIYQKIMKYIDQLN